METETEKSLRKRKGEAISWQQMKLTKYVSRMWKRFTKRTF